MSFVDHISVIGAPLTLALIAIVAIVFAAWIVWRSGAIVFIDNAEVGCVEKLWSSKGSVASGFIALDGSAGFQSETLRGGLHFLVPFQYRVHHQPLVTVPQGTIGYVFARGGRTLEPGQTLASNAATIDFEDARAFLTKGGQRGPQRAVLREGVYAINTAQFVVFTKVGTFAVRLNEDGSTLNDMGEMIGERGGFDPIVIKNDEDAVGVVTVHDGPALDVGEIIAPVVGVDAGDPATFHNNFQNADVFLAAGGRRGRQEMVLVEGTFIINRLFATVEIRRKTVIDVGFVGVVISYTGPRGEDVTGKDYRHGELVEIGQRGVWRTPLQPGKYALNPYSVNVVAIPTTNFVLRWITGSSQEHGLDSGLSEIKLITRDAFEPILPLSVVMHIACENAPRVIQQFGDIKLLVEQTLDPMVSAYFKDTAQTKTLIELINKRSEIQSSAILAMRERFALYNLDLMEVMIGTPRSQDGDSHINVILQQLRDRQVADEQLITYENQRRAAEKERELREASAGAANQSLLTQSKIAIEIAHNEGAAALRRREREAESIKVMAGAEAERIKITADAEAERIKLTADAEASRVRLVGEAQAVATEAQVRAFGGPEFQLAKDIAGLLQTAVVEAKVPLVPQISLGSTDAARPSSLIDALIGLAVSKGVALDPAPKADPSRD